MAALAAVVEGLAHHVQHLAMILDEVREDLVWAVRNDKLTRPNFSQDYAASMRRCDDRSVDGEPAEAEESPEPDGRIPPPRPRNSTLFE